MKKLLAATILGLTVGCASNPFTTVAFSEREYFESDMTWAMNQAYINEEIYGFEGVCEKRSRYAQTLVDGSYLVTMIVKRELAPVGKRSHMLLCKDGKCVDSTGVIADQYTEIPESDLQYFGYDITKI